MVTHAKNDQLSELEEYLTSLVFKELQKACPHIVEQVAKMETLEEMLSTLTAPATLIVVKAKPVFPEVGLGWKGRRYPS